MAALLDRDTGRVRRGSAIRSCAPASVGARGDVANVVFVQGAVPQPDGTIYVTYGAADRCVGAAYVATDRLLRALRAAV